MTRIKNTFKLIALLIIILNFSACTQHKSTNPVEPSKIHYTFTPKLNPNKENSLIISLDFIGDTDGITEVFLGRAWADEQTPYIRFHDVTAKHENQTLDGQLNDNGSVYTIKHKPNTPINLSYRLDENGGRPTTDSGYFYAPVLKNNVYHLIGWSSLAVPKFKRDQLGQRSVLVSLAWENLPPAWQTTHNITPNEAMPISDIFQTAIAAGNFTTIEQKIGSNTLSSMKVGNWSFTDEKFAEDLRIILTALNQSWHDDPTDYQVTLLPVMQQAGVSSITGTGLHHAFAAAGTTNLDVNNIIPFLAHEMTHDWIPGRLGQFPTCDDKQKDCATSIYWFSEGFTDYFALSLLKKHKLWTDAEYTTKVNDIIREYYMSPARNIENKQIQLEFWNNPDAERQPYLRGFLIALNWQTDIQNNPSHSNTIMDAFRDMKDKAKESENIPILTNEYIIEHFSEWAGRQLKNDFDNYIVNGKTITLNAKSLGTCATLTPKKIYNYDLGFDPNQTLSTNIFSGVKAESAGAKAGLKNGLQFIEKIKGGGGDTTQPIVLKVAENERVFEVQYLPIGETYVNVPQFSKSPTPNCIQAAE